MSTPQSAPGGEVVYRVLRTHPKVLFGPTVFALVASVVAIVALVFGSGVQIGPVSLIWVIVACWLVALLIGLVPPLMRWWFTTYRITSRAIRTRTGFVSRRERDLRFDRISAVETEQGVLDRIFACGTLVFYDPGGGSAGERLTDIPRVVSVKSLIENLTDGNPPDEPGH